ncbi:PspA/IM30 family protein [Lujinxingia vulgaris]|uniref:PspA/IM30 family protein n=1 Tax=Lujinxingia vulgaris TaxID=2600176 RepID=A0A5C6XK52_9DELT|nr:PspA/IM30 family protein [Lujinxingia vulgaris]TXD37686.1 PspA/IM30 family protein [Lujinxingia vulgaris]
MGLFNRIGTLLKANINDLISRAEDPEKILNQLILDMKEQLIQAKKQVAVTIADEKRLKKQLDNELQQARDWEKKAMMAVRAGRDDLAREALSRKKEHDDLSSEYQKQWEAQKAAADKLRDSLRQLNAKIEEASRKKNLLIARKKRAEAQKTIQETMSGLSDTSAFDAFDRMSGKIEQMEAEAEASAELAEGFSGDDLAAKFDALEDDHGADEALMALKAKMGVGAEKKETQFDFEEEEAEEKETVSAKRGTWDSDEF